MLAMSAANIFFVLMALALFVCSAACLTIWYLRRNALPALTQPGPSEPETTHVVIVSAEPAALEELAPLPVRTLNSAPNLRDALPPESLSKLTDWVAEFPPLSPTAVRLFAEVRTPDVRTDRIVKLVAQDPVLTMSMLRMSNSAAVAQTREITSVEQAILMLGLDVVIAVAMRATMQGLAVRHQKSGFDHEALLRHNVACGLMAGALARRISRANDAEATTAALLHDIGKVIMNASHPKLVSELLNIQSTRLGESRLGKEERLFGASHALIGALLASRWQLPAALINTIELHHHPAVVSMSVYPQRIKELTAIVFVANQLAKYARCSGDDLEIDLPTPELMEILNLPPTYEESYQLVLPEVQAPLQAFLAESEMRPSMSI